MALVREITVAFQLTPNSAKLERHSFTVPADAIPAEYGDALEVLQIPAVKRRFSPTQAPVWVEVGELFDPHGSGIVFG